MGIQKNVEEFLTYDQKKTVRHLDDRERSFDYCYNYFRGFFERSETRKLCSTDYMEASCLHLASYLASWGMYRGKSLLLKRSIHQYKDLVKYISEVHKDVWTIDVERYDDPRVIDLLLECEDQVRRCLLGNQRPSVTLTTKAMLGVFGNIPAFDTYFMLGLRVSDFNRKSLAKISDFYVSSRSEIDSQIIYTLDFDTNRKTQRVYSKAKIIDMNFFQEGYRISNEIRLSTIK